MAGPLDWVPAYGRVEATPTGGWQLFNMTGFPREFSDVVAQPELYEGDNQDFYLERVVGTISMWAEDSEVIPVCARILPLQYDLDVSPPVPVLPWAPGDDDAFVANFRFWWERRYNVVGPFPSGSNVTALVATNSVENDSPWWTQVDIRPK